MYVRSVRTTIAVQHLNKESVQCSAVFFSGSFMNPVHTQSFQIPCCKTILMKHTDQQKAPEITAESSRTLTGTKQARLISTQLVSISTAVAPSRHFSCNCNFISLYLSLSIKKLSFVYDVFFLSVIIKSL